MAVPLWWVEGGELLRDILSRGVVEPVMDRFDIELPGVESAKVPSVGVEGRGGGADWLGRLLAEERDGDEVIAMPRGGEAANDLLDTECGICELLLLLLMLGVGLPADLGIDDGGVTLEDEEETLEIGTRRGVLLATM